MKILRSLIFWLHLICGLVAGLVIGLMCFTPASISRFRA